MTAARRLLATPVVAGLLAALLLSQATPAATAAATPFSVRIEAGPHVGVTFDPAWRITGRQTVTTAAPATVTASDRTAVPGDGTWLLIASGALAGRWVRESTLSYVPGVVDVAAFGPARAVTLRAGSWELFRFDGTGTMTEARGRTVGTATTVHADQAATIRGRRHIRITDGEWAGWWLPGSLAAPLPITCDAGSPPRGAGPITIRSVPAATGRIALTFDMGGRLTPALSIIRYLQLERVCATIFATGAASDTPTGRAVLAEVAAHPELFELGNHTQHHCDLANGGGGAACPADPSAAFVQSELRDAEAVIEGISGLHTIPYWRPPYGSVNAAVRQAAAAAGWGYTLMWATDTIDSKPIADGGPTASAIVAKVVGNRSPGAVVLNHLGGYQTRNALPATIAGLRAAGYTPTSVSGLFR
jgi:peptidoglycan/xylan/chitin deacetylase (PgdA/CDA1 family)